MLIRPQSLLFTVVLGALSALPSLSIDMGLPGIPIMEASFPGASGRGALTLSLFLLGFSVAPMLCGLLSDRYGRKPILLGGLIVFSVAAGSCVISSSFHLLLVCRFIQGFAAGACVVLPQTIVRDLFEGSTARTRLSQVTTVLGLAPMIAPGLGGWVISFSNWQMIYLSQAVFGIMIFIAFSLGFSETLPPKARRLLNPSELFQSYRMVVLNQKFMSSALIYSFGFACMFSYISGSTIVWMREFCLSKFAYSAIFAITSCGLLIGSLLSSYLSKKNANPSVMIQFGLFSMAAAVTLLLAVSTLGFANVVVVSLLVLVVTFCFGLISPSLTHEAMSEVGEVAGSASGLMRCSQMLFGSIASALVALLESFAAPSVVMAFVMFASVAIAVGTYFLTTWKVRNVV